MIEATPKLSVDDFKHIQLDTVSNYAKAVAPLYASLTVTDTTLQPLISRFNGWDGNVTTDSVSAALYEVAFNHLMSSTLTSAPWATPSPGSTWRTPSARLRSS